MIRKFNKRLYFSYAEGSKQSNKLNLKLSLLGMLMGIFLLPNLAYLSSITPEEIIDLTNKERQAAGLNTLTANQLLTQAAINKGQAILETQTFKHNINDRKFSLWIRDTGYNYSYVGENLAIDFETSQGVVDAWKASPLHKKNLLSPYYQEIGISTIDGKFQGQDTIVVVQIFGSPAIASVQPLEEYSGFSSINKNSNLLLNDFNGYSFGSGENLLTHSILNQNLLPSNENKLLIPFENILGAASYKYFVQPETYGTIINYLLIFTSLTLIYLIIYLFFYYFYKIIKLASI